MQKLHIKSFKAHKDLEISLDNKSFLLYGDNGAGKSSIYDAIKIAFFRDKIEESIEVKDYAQEVTQADKAEFFAQYNNSVVKDDFEIVINENEFNASDYQLFMLNLEDTEFGKYLSLMNLIEKVYFDIDATVISKYQEIQDKANNLLSDFKEDITIRIDNEDDYTIKITDTSRGLDDKKDIKRYFNEAKLNLVVFSLFFTIIKLETNRTSYEKLKPNSNKLKQLDIQHQEYKLRSLEYKKKILVLDDFITSLDMSNRTFLMRHILETFNQNFQIIVLTHNVYFYNLIMYLVNDVFKKAKSWQFANLYEIDSQHKLYMNNYIVKIIDIEKQLQNENVDFQTIGNQIRQKFERLLYEFSKVLMIGAVEESNKILELLENGQSIYLKKQGNKDASDLLVEIEELLAKNNQHNLQNRIQTKINNYRLDTLGNIQNILRELKLYRKVSMHSLSHGRVGQSSWSRKEIEQSLCLLKKLEDSIGSLNTTEQRRTDGL